MQEWLWCETWCGNATKHYAKTIDLCNNPLTKEPKLQGARRIVSEWPGLDEEARSFTAQVLLAPAMQSSWHTTCKQPFHVQCFDSPSDLMRMVTYCMTETPDVVTVS